MTAGDPSGARRGGATRVVAAADRFTSRTRSGARPSRMALLALLLAVVLLAVGAWVVRFSSLLDTRTIAVRGASDAVAGQVRDRAQPALGRPLAAVDLAAVGRQAAAVTQVESATVERVWPHTLRVTVHPRVAVLAVAADQGVRLIDRHGVSFATAAQAPAGVPTVAAAQTADGRALTAAVTMLAALPDELRAKATKVDVQGPASMSFQLGATTVRWGDATQPELKVKVLRALLRQAPHVIDVSAPNAPATS